MRRFGVDPRPRDRGHLHHRRQGGLQPPHVGAAAAGRRRPRAVAVVPDPHLGPAVRRRRRARDPDGDRRNEDGDFFENMQEAYEYSWPKPRVIVLSFPHNPTTACVDLDFIQRGGRLRPREGRHRRPRQRLRRAGLRRLRAAVDPPGRGGQGVRGRAVLDDQVVLDGRLARGLPGRQPRGRAGAGQAQELPRLRHVPAHPDRRHRHAQRGARTTPARCSGSTRPAATRCATASTASAGRSSRPRARCSPGRRSPSPTARWARSSSPRCSCARPRWPRPRASASAPAATATCASPSSRTSSASTRPSATSSKALTKLGLTSPLSGRSGAERCAVEAEGDAASATSSAGSTPARG